MLLSEAMSDYKLTPQNAFVFIEDIVADQLVRLRKEFPERHAADTKIDGHFQKEKTRDLLRVLASRGRENQIPESFDDAEKAALATRVASPDPKKALAYVPRDIAEKFALTV